MLWADSRLWWCRWFSATCIINENRIGSKESSLRCCLKQLNNTQSKCFPALQCAKHRRRDRQHSFLNMHMGVTVLMCICVCFPRGRQRGTRQSRLCWNASSCAAVVFVIWETETPKWQRFPLTPPTSTRYCMRLITALCSNCCWYSLVKTCLQNICNLFQGQSISFS